jgi:hypothetical protein
MRGTVLMAVVASLLSSGPASAASVEVMVVGKSKTLKAPSEVRFKTRTVNVGGRRCAVGAATPLAALLALRLPLEVKDYGSCGRSARDGSGLFVRKAGPDRNRGRDGWVYKVGRKAGTAGAADVSGPFGDGRPLRDGQRVVWFWCVLSKTDSCQRTLEVTPAVRTLRRGETLRVRVRGFDDLGRGTPVPGAIVSLGGARGTTGADGFASIVVAPQASGTVDLAAEKPGTVPAFSREMVVE